MATTKAQICELLLSGLVDTSGLPLAAGKVYTYDAGTTTPKTTWTDPNKGTPAANPIILSAAGTAQIYGDGIYKFRVDNSADSTVATWDNIPLRYIETSVATWTPTYGAQAGTWAATTRIARYHRVGDIIHCQLYADATPSTTPTYLTFTLPFAATGTSFERYCQGLTTIAATSDVCHVFIPSSGTTARIYRRDLAAWANSATTVICNFWYEL